MALADGRAVLQNYANKIRGRNIAAGCHSKSVTAGIDGVMSRLGLLPGLHLHDSQALMQHEFTHSRFAAGPKYIVLQAGSQPWLKTRWGVYCLTRGVFSALSPFRLYLPEEFITENIEA